MNCPKAVIEDGCVYVDGSFALSDTDTLMNNGRKTFDFTLDGVRYTGKHTGLLAYRAGKFAMATEGSTLSVNGQPIELEVMKG